jgi:hypothetical protein
MNLLKALEGKGWSIQQAIQSTYSFDPRFYSSYVRPRLNKRNCDLPLVFVDANKYEKNITKPKWQEAPMGTDYLLEPVDSGGVFHPKVNIFASERSVFFSVSSANLTIEEYCKAAQIGQMAGFQKNWFTDDESEPSRGAVDAYYLSREIRDFLENLVEERDFVTGQDAINYTQEMTETLGWLEELEDEVETPLEDRSTFFLSSLSEPILSQTTEAIGNVGTARLYAPFYGTPNVLQDIADFLDPNQIELVVESESTALDTTGLEDALENHRFTVREMEHNSSRWVHAKFLSLEGEWGSACLHGSPNMTSSALLQSSSVGNVEAALLTIESPSDSSRLRSAVFESQEFDFSISEPVSDLSSLELRSVSYEGWESIEEREREVELRLEDVRLTQPDSDGNSELILKLSNIGEDVEESRITVRTDSGEEKKVDNRNNAEDEVSVLIPEGERPVWSDAVVRVDVDRVGETNPRRVAIETQAYHRELREIVKSEGKQSSNTLLREVLENPDTTVMSVFDVALSELRKSSESIETAEGNVTGKTEEKERFPERNPTRLSKGGRQVPSLTNLVKNHLAYHQERALDSLELEDTPVPEDLEKCVEHSRTFWETIELCYILERNDEIDTGQIDVDGLFKVCEGGISEWLSNLNTLVRRLNGIITQIENNDSVRDNFVKGGEEVKQLEVFESVFEVLLLHPGLVLEFDYKSDFKVYSAKNRLANRIEDSLDIVHPPVEQHLYRGTELTDRIKNMLSNLTVEFGGEETSINISGDGIRALVFYSFIQQVSHTSSLIQNLKSHYSQEDLRLLANLSVDGKQKAVDYGIINSLTLTAYLNDEIDEIEELTG